MNNLIHSNIIYIFDQWPKTKIFFFTFFLNNTQCFEKLLQIKLYKYLKKIQTLWNLTFTLKNGSMRNVWNDCFYRFLSLAKHVPIILFHYLFFFAKISKKNRKQWFICWWKRRLKAKSKYTQCEQITFGLLMILIVNYTTIF